jgi:hypothetical protein
MENGSTIENVEISDRRGAATSRPTQSDATSIGGCVRNSGVAWPRSSDTVTVGQQGLRLVPNKLPMSTQLTLPENSVALNKQRVESQ